MSVLFFKQRQEELLNGLLPQVQGRRLLHLGDLEATEPSFLTSLRPSDWTDGYLARACKLLQSWSKSWWDEVEADNACQSRVPEFLPKRVPALQRRRLTFTNLCAGKGGELWVHVLSGTKRRLNIWTKAGWKIPY